MTILRISQIEAGQQVASEVKDRSGRILLKAGTTLTEKNIKIIKSWGVVEVDILGSLPGVESVPNSEYASYAGVQAIENELSNKFRFVNRSHPLINELFGICLLRKISQAKD